MWEAPHAALSMITYGITAFKPYGLGSSESMALGQLSQVSWHFNGRLHFQPL